MTIAIKQKTEKASPVTQKGDDNTPSVNINITINVAPGMNERDLGRHVEEVVRGAFRSGLIRNREHIQRTVEQTRRVAN